jgi:hypothetical protein
VRGRSPVLEDVHSCLKRVVYDYCEYSGLSYEEVVKLIRRAPEFARGEWHEFVRRSSDDEVYRFYIDSKYYNMRYFMSIPKLINIIKLNILIINKL